MTTHILKHFPLDKPRQSQVEVLKAIEEAFKKGYRNVLLEAPVGSGKSAIAVAAANFLSEAHILTPMKSLQDQYFEDFESTGLALMKGRNAYPCLFASADSCADGPCLVNKSIKESCLPCPYDSAIETAQESNLVVHNLHSFIFQAYYVGRFFPRKLMVIDECHKIEDVIRGFATKKVSLPIYMKDEERPTIEENSSLEEWADWLSGYAHLYSDRKDKKGVSARDRFNSSILMLEDLSDKVGKDFVISSFSDPFSKVTTFEFVPVRVGDLANKLLFDFGEKRLFMSGTIYNKAIFCNTLGLKDEETCFIRIGSSFPKETRPIYMKKKYLVDTSHKVWDQNYGRMIEIIKEVSSVFNDVKGLIHTPSYKASQDIHRTLADPRFVLHTSENFGQVLSEFYESKEPKILLSPICQQGVDFKYDRARFQMILRVPYANTSDAFVSEMVKTNFSWYNHQALVLFGQQIGRVNRAEDDFGATILIDSRFEKFIHKNRSVLPKWVTESIIQ